MATAKGIMGPGPLTERGTAGKLDAGMNGRKLVYSCGSTVVIRDIKNPGVCEANTEHRNPVNVARFSPNGSFVASGDQGGVVRVWSCTNPNHILKKEMQLLPGPVLDIDWDKDSKRIIVGGDGGKSAHAKCVMAETGSTLGEITGNTKPVQAVAYRPTKPFRVVVGSQDFKTSIYNGPPFKFNKSHQEHDNFVTSVVYSPDGSLVVSSAGKKIVMASGEELEVKGALPEEHKGTIYSLAFSKDGKKIVSSSSDKTVKLWDIETQKVVHSFAIGDQELGDMAVAVVYGRANDQIITSTLDGSLHWCDAGSGSVTQTVEAHIDIPKSLTCDYVSGKNDLYMGCDGGAVVRFEADSQLGHQITGSGHSATCSGVAAKGGVVHTVGWDDTLRGVENDGFAGQVSLGGQPHTVQSMPATPDLAVVCTTSKVMVVRDGSEVVAELAVQGYDATAAGISPDGLRLCVGSSKKEAYLYDVKDGEVEPTDVVMDKLQGKPTVVSYSPDGKYIAIGDSFKEITVWNASDGENKIRGKWVFHQSAITDVSWSPNSQYLASGSIDTQLYVWNVEKPMKKLKQAHANPGGVTGVAWIDDKTVATCGADRCIRKYMFKKLPGAE